MTDPAPANWSLWTGRRQGDAAPWMNEHVKDHPPLLLWCEPLNGRQRRLGFGLLDPAGMSPLPAGSLTEARLFYDDGLLHLLAAPSGWRFAAWREGEHDQMPAWCPAEVLPPSLASEQPTSSAMKIGGGTRTDRTILLNHLAGTRGLDVTDVSDRVTVVEYYECGVLRWWRLKRHG